MKEWMGGGESENSAVCRGRRADKQPSVKEVESRTLRHLDVCNGDRVFGNLCSVALVMIDICFRRKVERNAFHELRDQILNTSRAFAARNESSTY